jgi:uncharacterized membrane protein YedE/YeeE
MTFPLSYLSDFDSLSGTPRAVGLGVAVAVGIAFGFVLERGGFGRAQKLVGQFYGRDMTVLRVMFTGIASAMVGAVILSSVGVLDLEAVQFNYPTFLWPMIVGGLVLGAGFVMSGYCPGTSFVATASGKLDGLATVLGVVAGSLVYAEVEPRLGGFQNSGKLGTFTLSKWLHLPPAVIAALVVALAIVSFVFASKIERRLAGQAAPAVSPAVTAASEHKESPMKKVAVVLSLAVAFTLATGTAARAEEKLLGVVAKIDVSGDGNSAVAILKDSKSGQPLDIAVEDKVTLDKFKDHRISVGDEIKCKYEKQGAKNLATYFKKAGGC